MKVLSYLSNILPTRKNKYRNYLLDSKPIFTDFGNDIYLSDFVNNAIERIANEISKIDVKSVVEISGKIKVQNDDITRLFRTKPNQLQTTSDFLANVEWIRRKHRNVFIFPTYEIIKLSNGNTYKKYTALYPLKPIQFELRLDETGNVWEVLFYFENGESFPVPYSELIHLKWRRGASTTIGGGDDNGQENDYEIRRTLDALDKTIQGLPKMIEASMQIKGLFHSKTLVNNDGIKKARDDFESRIISSKSGIVATDLAGDFTPMDIKMTQIPDSTLKFLKGVMQERYGVSAAILSGDYTGDQHSAFYQTAIEDFLIQFEQAFTHHLYTSRELDVGHKLKCYYNKVRYYSTTDKLKLADLAKETGIMTLNQVNEMFGIEPFEAGNRRLQSLNYVNLDIVDEYQKTNNKKGGESSAN